MGLFGKIYDKNLFKGRNDIEKLYQSGQTDYEYGQGLTQEGITGLRSLRSTYDDRTRDPLGDVGRGIFARARGNLSDDFTRTVNAGDARRRQLAAQSGGSLSPEQIAALDAGDRRTAGEGLFRAEGDLSNTEADMTLTEQSKFFDRLEGIDRAIGAVGDAEKSRGLSQIMANLSARGAKDAQKRSILSSFANSLVGGASSAASGSGYYGSYQSSQPTTGTNPWGVGTA